MKNKKSSKITKNRKIVLSVIITIVFIILLVITLILINKQNLSSDVTPVETEHKEAVKQKNPENYTAVMSLDNIEVPVPTGYTASSVESERYVNGINEVHKGTAKTLALSSEGEYAWTQNEEDGVWSSGNYNVASSSSILESEEFEIGENGGHIKVNWSVSSQYGNDVLYATIISVETGEEERCPSISNTIYGTKYENLVYVDYDKELEAGRYKVILTYSKNGSSNSGLDKGYVKSVEVVNYSADGTGEAEAVEHKYGGFVIYEGDEEVNESNLLEAQKTRNQWVWVPVNDPSRIYSETNGVKTGKYYSNWTLTGRGSSSTGTEPKALTGSYDTPQYFSRYGLEGMTRENFDQELRIEFEEAIESIKTYGGFYIGRYETGSVSTNEPVVRKMNTDIASQTWYAMYGKMEVLGRSMSVKANMIWGCLWDEALQWLVESGSKTYGEIRNSTSWGNYYDSIFKYTNTNGTEATKSIGSTRIPSGSSEYTKANNVYDMAGNVYDRTLEADGTNYRYSRGGGYNSNGSNGPAYHRFSSIPYNSSSFLGFRAYFYIK